MPLANGEDFAGHRIVRRLGSGGMGEVYLADHPNLPLKVALKILRAEISADPRFRQKFYDEADNAAALVDHSLIVRVLDRDVYDGQLWISFEFIDGTDAEQRLRDAYPAGLPRPQVVEIVSAVADALDYAHDKGLLHRDVKPGNILLRKPDAPGRRILLADFGIARRLDRSLTYPAYFVGTLAYAAPEQRNGEALDGRADQYALAVTAYQLLTGSLPFDHPNFDVYRPIAGIRPGLADLDPILRKALSKRPSDRFRNCSDFAEALTTARSEAYRPPPQQTPRTKPAPPPTKGSPVFRAKKRTGGFSHLFETFFDRLETFFDRLETFSHLLGTLLLTTAIVGVCWFLVASGLGASVWQSVRSAIGTNSGPVTSAPTSVAPSITFDGMRDFVAGYYADLPARPYDAWAKTTHAQDQTGQAEYLAFWAKIQSVMVVSVSPRDATSVVARLKYIRNDGYSETEDRWLTIILVDGVMRLDQSGRIGSVNEAMTTTAPPSPTTGIATLVGRWQGHHRELTVSADGTITMDIPDYAACPECDAASMPPATVHIGLTSYGDGKFFGYVKDSSDTRVVPTGLPVEVDVVAAKDYRYMGRPADQKAPGRVMTISIKGMPVSDNWNSDPLGHNSPFCDQAALGTVCGA